MNKGIKRVIKGICNTIQCKTMFLMFIDLLQARNNVYIHCERVKQATGKTVENIRV